MLNLQAARDQSAQVAIIVNTGHLFHREGQAKRFFDRGKQKKTFQRCLLHQRFRVCLRSQLLRRDAQCLCDNRLEF